MHTPPHMPEIDTATSAVDAVDAVDAVQTDAVDAVAVAVDAPAPDPAPPKRGRGRPRKYPVGTKPPKPKPKPKPPKPLGTPRKSPRQRMTPHQIRFCHHYVRTSSAAQAAREAGYSPKFAHVSGPNLLKNKKCAKLIDDLQASAVARTAISTDYVIARLMDEASGTGPDTTSSARIRAAELLGKYLGMFVERHEHGRPGDFEALDAVELDDRIARLTLAVKLGDPVPSPAPAIAPIVEEIAAIDTATTGTAESAENASVESVPAPDSVLLLEEHFA